MTKKTHKNATKKPTIKPMVAADKTLHRNIGAGPKNQRATIPMISGKGRQQKSAKHAAQANRAHLQPIRAATNASGGRGKKREGMSGLDATAKVLADAGKPLNTIEIVKNMLGKGLWKTAGKTPHSTIYAAIIRDIATKGSASRFRKTERGHFTLAEKPSKKGA